MLITKLHIQDFRGIRELDIGFEPDITVLVGRNGAGKTSLLDALAILMWVVLPFTLSRTRWLLDLSRQDVRSGADTFGLSVELKFEGQSGRPEETISADIKTAGSLEGAEISNNTRAAELWNRAEFRPRIIYYRQHRGFEPEEFEGDEPDNVFDPELVQSMSMHRNLRAIGDLETWWDHRDAEEARAVRDKEDPSYRDPQLEAVRSLVTKIDSFSGIRFVGASIPRGLHLVKSNGTVVHVNNLSSGERSYIILLADLARRLQVFAPDTPLEKIPAIVMIDEVELNLHPAWQGEILATLCSVFQACQFIVTTHSPQVLSGVGNRHVRILEIDSSGYIEVITPSSTRGRTSNYLLEGVLGASRRYPPVAKLIDEFNLAIDRGDRATAQEKLGQVQAAIGATTPSIKVLTKRLEKLNRES